MIARGEYLVDPRWLIEHLPDPNLLVVDCRFAADRQSSRQAYREAHIPGAVHVYWLEDLCAPDTRVTSLLPDPKRARERLARLGVAADSQVVGYADNADLYAARLWHVLRCNGHRQVRLLDGGIEGWLAAGGQTEVGENVARPADFPVRPALSTLIGTQEIRDRLDDPSLQLIDVRSAAEYEGRDVRADRGGHIPGAVPLPWDELVTTDGHFLPASAIRDRCARAGLDPAREIVTYCQGGVRAAHTALALESAGFGPIRVYDGSWAVWGNDPDLPIVVPAATPH